MKLQDAIGVDHIERVEAVVDVELVLKIDAFLSPELLVVGMKLTMFSCDIG